VATPRRELILAAASLQAALMSAPLLSQPSACTGRTAWRTWGRFPVVVYIGATNNVMVEILFIYWLYDRVGGRLSVGFQGIGWRGGWKADRAVSKCSFVPLEWQTTIKTQPKISYVD